jgi:hypothetical protein
LFLLSVRVLGLVQAPSYQLKGQSAIVGTVIIHKAVVRFKFLRARETPLGQGESDCQRRRVCNLLLLKAEPGTTLGERHPLAPTDSLGATFLTTVAVVSPESSRLSTPLGSGSGSPFGPFFLRSSKVSHLSALHVYHPLSSDPKVSHEARNPVG